MSKTFYKKLSIHVSLSGSKNADLTDRKISFDLDAKCLEENFGKYFII